MPTRTLPTAVGLAHADFEALNGRDLDAAEALWHPDVVDDFVVLGAFRGRRAVRGLFEEIFAAVPDFILAPQEFLGGDEHATVRWRATGTFTGSPFMGIHATGRSVDLRGVDVMRWVDGLLVHNTIYYDGLAFARQIGLLPTEGSVGDKAVLAAFNAKTDTVSRMSSLLRRSG
jgi:steroid delta-isomerase-like uncharacterized protein